MLHEGETLEAPGQTCCNPPQPYEVTLPGDAEPTGGCGATKWSWWCLVALACRHEPLRTRNPTDYQGKQRLQDTQRAQRNLLMEWCNSTAGSVPWQGLTCSYPPQRGPNK
ncbi:hypothetical protein GWK47_018058 [Chionoecetes opilio]|uniref:Uncharacterized protein n=1 Tax=Chionoecetes opilio TaxID=41210 RepID=A0A8J4XVE7_CHIOP|nr:hypothetical protein GWK47_018058 [Chionoecetes opilio]